LKLRVAGIEAVENDLGFAASAVESTPIRLRALKKHLFTVR
jgi:hypothetical protein